MPFCESAEQQLRTSRAALDHNPTPNCTCLQHEGGFLVHCRGGGGELHEFCWREMDAHRPHHAGVGGRARGELLGDDEESGAASPKKLHARSSRTAHTREQLWSAGRRRRSRLRNSPSTVWWSGDGRIRGRRATGVAGHHAAEGEGRMAGGWTALAGGVGMWEDGCGSR